MKVENRKIIHVDMDAFFASVEQMDRPELRNKAIAVGGFRERGVVAAASYEARKFGVHSALPSRIALRRCPNLIFVEPRFDRYKEISLKVQSILMEFTNLVEPLSLDEAYLDVTYNKAGISSAMKIAAIIRKRIKEEIGLTASAGVSFNKFLAKTASDLNKPDGLSVILPEQAIPFMEKLPIEEFHGIGKVTAEKMKKNGIFYGADLMKLEKRELMNRYGKSGRHYFNILRANDLREVKPNRIRKSIGAESTFSKNLENEREHIEKLVMIHEKLMQRFQINGRKGKTITLKIKYFDFEIRSRSITINEYTDDPALIWNHVLDLLKTPELPHKAVRLLGVSISNLDEKERDQKGQLTLEF